MSALMQHKHARTLQRQAERVMQTGEAALTTRRTSKASNFEVCSRHSVGLQPVTNAPVSLGSDLALRKWNLPIGVTWNVRCAEALRVARVM